MADKWIEALLLGAKDADEAFQAAVIKQFGRKNAGTMRYVGSKHNEETRAAAENYWQAAARLCDALEAARKGNGAEVSGVA